MQYQQLPQQSIVEITIKALMKRGITPYIVETAPKALEKIISLIPDGAKVANGSSTTLNQIGYIKYLKEASPNWINLQERVVQEKDPSKQADLRRQNTTDADYFLGSVNALTQDGLIVAVDATGSRVGAYPFTAKNLILVTSTQKIVPTLDDAFKRIRDYVFPLENARAQEAYGMGSTFGKWVIIEKEFVPDRIQLILVNEVLGF